MYILLFLIGIMLVIVNWRAIRKEKTSFKGTMELATLDVEEIDLKVGLVRREFAETITELQREIIDLREIVENLQSSSKVNIKDLYDEEKSYSNNILKEDLVIDEELVQNSTNEPKNLYNKNAKNEEIGYNEDKDNLLCINEERNQRAMELLKQLDGLTPNNFEEEKNIAPVGAISKNEVPNNNLKVTDVRKLFEEGLTLDEIAVKLNMGKGEVLLIKELYLK